MSHSASSCSSVLSESVNTVDCRMSSTRCRSVSITSSRSSTRVPRRSSTWPPVVSVVTSKGPNIAGVDPDTGQLTRLFHPRRDIWSEHFHWNGPTVCGLTAIGRVTLYVLDINDPVRIEHRRLLIEEGVFPLERM